MVFRYYAVKNPVGPIHTSEIFPDHIPDDFTAYVPATYVLGQAIYNKMLNRTMLVTLDPATVSMTDIRRMRDELSVWWFPARYERDPDCVLPPTCFERDRPVTSESSGDDTSDDGHNDDDRDSLHSAASLAKRTRAAAGSPVRSPSPRRGRGGFFRLQVEIPVVLHFLMYPFQIVRLVPLPRLHRLRSERRLKTGINPLKLKRIYTRLRVVSPLINMLLARLSPTPRLSC